MTKIKDKPKPEGDPFVRGAKNIFPVELELESDNVYIITKGSTPKGAGLTTLGFTIQEVWMDKEGNIIVFADPDKQMKGKQYNKYGEEITRVDLKDTKLLEHSKKGK